MLAKSTTAVIKANAEFCKEKQLVPSRIVMYHPVVDDVCLVQFCNNE